jgi:hypothetical protein
MQSAAARLSGSASDVTHGLFRNCIFIIRGMPAATCISFYIYIQLEGNQSINTHTSKIITKIPPES